MSIWPFRYKEGTVRTQKRGAKALPKREIERGMVDMLRSLPMQVVLALGSARDRDDGQAMVEYALLLFLIAIVSFVILTTLGTKVSSLFNTVTLDL